MPWHVVKNSSQCPDSKPYGVVKDSDGSLVACHASESDANDHLAALYASEQSSQADRQDVADRLQELRDFLPDVDENLQRYFPFAVEELRDSGDKLSLYNVRGYASVYDSWSLDLGGFRERIMPGAFDEVLEAGPAVAHVWDHDTSKILSATWNDTLTLSSDTHGLQFYSRVAKTDYAKDLRVLLERRDIKEASFAFTVAEDGEEWRIVEENDREIIERDITRVNGLYDVTTCAMGAYPATTSALALRSIVRGRSPAVRAMLVAQVQEEPGGEPQEVAPETEGTPQASEVDAEKEKRDIEEWKERRKADYLSTRRFAFGVNSDKETNE